MKRKIVLFVSVALLSLVNTFEQSTAFGQSLREAAPFKIIGYYPFQAAQAANPKEVAFDKLTHINLWFVNPDAAGSFKQDFSLLTPFIAAAHQQGVKVLFSIGGGSKQAQYRDLLQPGKRSRLVDTLVALTLQYQVDGIDVDLEGSDIDEHYEDFVVELAASLRARNKLITAAIAVYYKDQLTDEALSQFDFVNVMSYDRTGPWRPEKPGPHATYAHAKEDLAYFRKVRGIARDKITLGVPFYGYGFGPGLTSAAISMNYAQILTTFPGAQGADQWTMPDGKVIYYNGIATIRRKTALAKRKASGVMIWQLPGDAPAPHSLLDAIYATANK